MGFLILEKDDILLWLKKNKIIEKNFELIKFEDGDFSLDVNVSPIEDTVWLTQAQIAEL
jgi:hypothetical protein